MVAAVSTPRTGQTGDFVPILFEVQPPALGNPMLGSGPIIFLA